MTIKTTATVFTLVTALAAGSAAFAKGHDQGAGPNGSPATAAGDNAGAETAVTAQQNLGQGAVNGKQGARGNSAEANAQD